MFSELKLNLFDSVREPQVTTTVSLQTVLHSIKTGGEKKNLIEKARIALLVKGNKKEYNDIKQSLPCTNWAYTFEGYRSRKYILFPTGLISLEVDGSTKLSKNKFILFSYITLSTNGRAFVVQVQNLTLDNYKFNYKLIANELGINADLNSAKATQPFILSYDTNLFYNSKADVWIAYNEEKAQHIQEKKERGIGNVLGSYQGNRRFSDYHEHIENNEFNGEPSLYLKEIIKIATVSIPRNGINKGKRNSIIYAIGCQFRALNPSVDLIDVLNLLSNINKKHCFPHLPEQEIRKIVASIMKIEVLDLELNFNETRRFLFNPDYDLTVSEKRSLVMTTLNQNRTTKTIQEIEHAIEDWDFELNGTITQKTLSISTGKNIKTIKKYYSIFKSEIQLLNKEFKPP